MSPLILKHKMTIVSLLLIFGCFFIWTGIQNKTEAVAKNTVDRRQIRADIERAQLIIQTQMSLYANSLHAVRGLFDTTPYVTREQYRDYVEGLGVEKRLPGLSAFGYSRVVNSSEVDVYVSGVRADRSVNRLGYPNFHIYPESNKSTYLVLTYLAPNVGLDSALGYDLTSDHTREKVVEIARDSNMETISGKIHGVGSAENQFSILMTLPIYRFQSHPKTLQERRAAFVGVINAGFRIDELFGVIFPEDSNTLSERIEVFDGEEPNPEQLLFDSQRLQSIDTREVIQETSSFPMFGRTWTIRLSLPL